MAVRACSFRSCSAWASSTAFCSALTRYVRLPKPPSSPTSKAATFATIVQPGAPKAAPVAISAAAASPVVIQAAVRLARPPVAITAMTARTISGPPSGRPAPAAVTTASAPRTQDGSAPKRRPADRLLAIAVHAAMSTPARTYTAISAAR